MFEFSDLLLFLITNTINVILEDFEGEKWREEIRTVKLISLITTYYKVDFFVLVG